MHPPTRSFALLAALVATAALVTGCAVLPGFGADRRLTNPPALHDDESGDARAKQAALDQVDAYYAAMKLAKEKPADTPVQLAYVEEGIGLVDTYCRRWFARLEMFERASDKAAKDTNVLTQMVTALIGVAKLHPDVTAVYGASTTALSGLRSNQTDGLVIASSSKGVKAKVFVTLDESAARIRSDPPQTFVAAREDLERYADLCTWRSAKELVDKAVSSSDLSVSRSGEVTAVPTGTFGVNQASIVLRKLWKPDGNTIDPTVDRAIKDYMRQRHIDTHIWLFLKDGGYATERKRLLDTIQLD